MKRKRATGKRKSVMPLAKNTLQNDATLVEDYDSKDIFTCYDQNDGTEQPENRALGKSAADERAEVNATSLKYENIYGLGSLSKVAGSVAANQSRDNGFPAKFNSRVGTDTARIDSNTRGQQADLEIEEDVKGRMGSYPNALRGMIVSIIKDMSMEAGGLTNLSRSLVDSPSSNQQMLQSHDDMAPVENANLACQNTEYKEQELKAALVVIKKTMKLDAADPFNRPVDPISLGIPDYFDIIDTPMDLGTICYNLENGLKYFNSADVYKDVQCIWDNCLKYNKKGDHILELMKRVKTFFMKYWIASGLQREQPPAIVESEAPHNMHEGQSSKSPVTPVTGNGVVGQLYSSSLNESKAQSSSNQQHNGNTGAAASSISMHIKHGKDYSLAPPTNNLVNLQQNEADPDGVVDNQLLPTKSEADQPQQNSSQPESSPQQEEPNIDSTSIQKKRQGRGPTRCLKLLNTVGRIVVSTNELGQPVGPEAAQLTSFLGLIARDGNFAPLTYTSWSKMPGENKENMWQKVLTKFDIDHSCRSWVMMSLATKWRNFKSLLKANHYDTHATDEERLADRDERVLPDQWSVLVSQWSSEKWQNISAQNKANRARQKFSHTSGKKSFARIREEERAKRPNGQEPSRAELFILTRTRKNGKPVNEATAAVISQLRESTTEKGVASVNTTEPQDDAYTRVMGQDRKGGVSLHGLSATGTRTGTEIFTRSEAMKIVTEQNAEILEMKKKLVSVEQTCAQMASQMSLMVSMMANMQKNSPGENFSNAVTGTLVPVVLPNQSEPTPASHPEAPSRQARGRKSRR